MCILGLNHWTVVGREALGFVEVVEVVFLFEGCGWCSGGGAVSSVVLMGCCLMF